MLLEACLWNSAWANECKYSSKKDKLNLASKRFYTTPLHSKSFSSDKESSEEFFKEISTAHSSSIRMFPKNTPPLKPLVKSPCLFKEGKPVSASWSGVSSSYSYDFLEDPEKEHMASWRKGEETSAKWLKEGKDIGGFAITKEKGRKEA